MSVFTKITNGEISCYKAAEDNELTAFFDINLNAKRHALCVSKQGVSYIFDMGDDHYLRLTTFSRWTTKALEKVVPYERIGVTAVGLEVSHIYIHLIPISEMKEMTPRHEVKLTDEEFRGLSERVCKAL